MAYIYCDACGTGFHSNVHSCPECGRTVTRSYHVGLMAHGRRRHTHAHADAGYADGAGHANAGSVREDVESEVRESIYGWRSGTVELCDAHTASSTRS